MTSLKETVAAALKAANGKGYAEAVEIISAAVEAMGKDIPLSISIEEPRPVVTLTELAPIGVQRAEKRMTMEEVQRLATDFFPLKIEVARDGASASDPKVEMDRSIQVSQGGVSDCVQVLYRPQGLDPSAPYPHCFLWLNEGSWDLPRMLDKLKWEGGQMYRVPKGPIVNRAIIRPLGSPVPGGGWTSAEER